MPSAPAEAICPPVLYHVGRTNSPLRFSEIDALDAELIGVGNRFDVVGGGVLYAATEQIGAYKETVASMRPAASSHSFTPDATEHFMNLGALPAEWRDARRMVTFGLKEALPFLDLEQDSTLTFLTTRMADALVELNVERLDSSSVRGSDRLLTRAIANWAYTAVDGDDRPVYSGIRYCSRFQSHECWAIFEGIDFGDIALSSIEADDVHLLEAAGDFGITVH